jgi:hypothetical protein
MYYNLSQINNQISKFGTNTHHKTDTTKYTTAKRPKYRLYRILPEKPPNYTPQQKNPVKRQIQSVTAKQA